MLRSRSWTVGVIAVVCVPLLLAVLWKTALTDDGGASSPRDSHPSAPVSADRQSSVLSITESPTVQSDESHRQETPPNATSPVSAGEPAQNSSANANKERQQTATKPVAKQELSAELKAKIAASARKLGEQEIRVDGADTFFFRHGEYVTHPYIIRRDGYELSTNGFTGTRLPAISDDYVTERPKLPDHLLQRDISWKEIDAKEPLSKTHWRNQQLRWFLAHYPLPEAKKLFVEFIRTLPFVKTAEWRNGIPRQYLHVVSHADDARDFFASWWDSDKKAQAFTQFVTGFPVDDIHRPFSAGRLKFFDEILAKRMKGSEKMLRSGVVVFVGETGAVRVPRDSAQWTNIVDVIAILKSDASDKLKTHEIYPRIVNKFNQQDDDFVRSRSHEWKVIKQLVRNFKGHPQLDGRIAKLKKQHNIPDWKQPAEPPQPKVPDKLKNDPRLTPEGAVREALRLWEAKDYQTYIDSYKTPGRYGKTTVKHIIESPYTKSFLLVLRNIQNKKSVIDDIDDTCYFLVDDPQLSKQGGVFKEFRLRKIGHVWLIGL